MCSLRCRGLLYPSISYIYSLARILAEGHSSREFLLCPLLHQAFLSKCLPPRNVVVLRSPLCLSNGTTSQDPLPPGAVLCTIAGSWVRGAPRSADLEATSPGVDRQHPAPSHGLASSAPGSALVDTAVDTANPANTIPWARLRHGSILQNATAARAASPWQAEAAGNQPAHALADAGVPELPEEAGRQAGPEMARRAGGALPRR